MKHGVGIGTTYLFRGGGWERDCVLASLSTTDFLRYCVDYNMTVVVEPMVV